MVSNVAVLALVFELVFFSVVSCVVTDDVVVKLSKDADADQVAEQHGYLNMGQVHSGLVERMYHFKKRDGKEARVKRDLTELLYHEHVEYFEEDEMIDIEKRKRKSDEDTSLSKRYNDPSWSKEWFLNSLDAGVYQDYGYNINVVPAWEQGYNGSGVILCVVDDGVEKSHPDLVENFDPDASFDLQGNKADPTPRYAAGEPNRHGTRCAGEIAGKKNNGVCGVGVAHGAKIGGIRILDGSVTRLMESKALGFNTSYIDIYSASWGPPDNGKAMDGPKGVTAMVIEEAIKQGRDGKGSIYVWAGGNGGKTDDCNADGYQTMRYSISIQAVGMNGDTPYYAEPCASALASTFSSGYVHSIATTDLHGECTESHSGTSAAAPIAAGIIALALQANPNLTWRDVQHVIIRSSVPDLLYHHGGWNRNGAGRSTHINFGYGIVDASRMVNIAENWANVGEDLMCQSEEQVHDRNIPAMENLTVEIPFKGCNETINSTINALEHVYLVIDISAEKRGDITVDLTSPSGTKVQLISTRAYDNDSNGFKNWKLNTVFMFGEHPEGTWTVEIANNGKKSAELNTLYLEVYGTEDIPQENYKFPESDDLSVCSTLCRLVDKRVYNSEERCRQCNDTVQIDIARRYST